jgi:hypothetical protein
MNSTVPQLARSSRRPKMNIPVALSWSHCGIAYRVTPWPEIQFERRYGDDWIAATPDDGVFASGALACGAREWRPFLEFVPAEIREFLARFEFMRLEALLVAARCPALLGELTQTPALVAFVSSHASLRGTSAPSWDEINAVHERSGIFGVLEWLGLPASRQTLAILGNVAEPDVPKRFLEPLRSMLWEPRTIYALQRTPDITDRVLSRYCHALAA